MKLSGVLHTFEGGVPFRRFGNCLFFRTMFLGMSIIVGPQTPPPPPNCSTPLQKVLSSAPILMKQKPKDRFWSKLFFGQKNFKIFYNFFFKKSKTRFSKKVNSIKILNFFSQKKKFRPKPIFWFLFHQNQSTKKYFLRGCTTVGGRGGGSVA